MRPQKSVKNLEKSRKNDLLCKMFYIEPQSEEEIKALQDAGLTNYINVRSAMLHGII